MENVDQYLRWLQWLHQLPLARSSHYLLEKKGENAGMLNVYELK